MIRKEKCIVLAFVAIFSCCAVHAQSRVMSLRELLDYADSASLQLRAANEETAAAQTGLDATRRATLTPDVRFDFGLGYLGDGYGWGRDSSYSFRVPMPHFSTTFAAGASQVVYAGGALRAARDKAALGLRMQQATAEQRRQDLRLQLVALYLDLCRTRQQLEVYDSNIALAQQLADQIGARREQGIALRNDQTRQELRLAALRMQRATAQNDVRIVGSRIATLAGLPAGTQIEPDSGFLGEHWMPSEGEAIGVQIATLAEAIAEADEVATRAELLPRVAIVAKDNLVGPVTIDITPYNINYNYWFVGVAASYDLGSLWKSRTRLHAARHTTAARQAARQAAQAETARAVNEAWTRLDESRSNLSLCEQSQRLAQENYDLVCSRYAADMALMIDLTDAANMKLQAELDVVAARLAVAYRQYTIDYINGKL